MVKSLFVLVVITNLLLIVSSEDSSNTESAGKLPSSKGCRRNERWVECPISLCVPFKCEDLGKPIACPRIIPGRCPSKPACVCIEGYVKDSNGVCVPKKKCPSCGGDRNAEAGCGFICGSKCGKNGAPPTQGNCKRFKEQGLCGINSCQCKSGFVYDDNQRICVRPKDCSKPCPENEVYTSCANGGCGKWNCTQIDEPTLCIDPIECEGDCICMKGYLRRKNGKCIPEDECRSANEEDGDGERPPPTTEEPDTTASPSECPSNLQELLVNANSKFTGLFLYNAMINQPGENVIMSPFSVLTPIAQLAYFSQGETLKQFLSVLNLSSKEHIKCVFPPLLEGLSSQENVILNLAVRIFATDSYPLTKNFLDYSSDVFKAVPESLDFSDGEASAKRINQWAANSTNNRITDIANPTMFSGETRLVLANAIYFLGNWEHQFDGNNTEDRDFYVSKDNVVQIPTMYQLNSFKYAQSTTLGVQMVEMSYKGSNFSFVIFLPNEIDGLEKVVEDLQDPSTFYEAYDSTTVERVEVYLPKIKTESTHNLGDIMQKAGLTDAFSPGKSNITGILQIFEPLDISSATQKAFGYVNEKGTEAAAVNLIVVGTTSVGPRPQNYVFKCDRPFAYYIMFGRIPIFSGIFAKPGPATE